MNFQGKTSYGNAMKHNKLPAFVRGLLSLTLIGLANFATAANGAVVLQDIGYTVLPGDELQIKLTLSGTAPQPGSFTIDNPARIAVDLPNTTLGVEKDYIPMDTGMARSIRAVQAGDRTRLVVGLTHLVPYEVRSQDNIVFLNIRGKAGAAAAAPVAGGARVSAPVAGSRIENIDFRRGAEGEGRIVVELSDPSAIVDMREKGGKIIVDFLNTRLPETLQRRLDVTDFATPVTTVDAYNYDTGARMTITAVGDYENLAYQTGNAFTVDVKKVSKEEKAKKAKPQYTGEKLSLNFQNIEVRAVLQLLADFTGLNIVASDTVQGTITLRLKNVPWDQALDIILKTRGLGKRQSGNVILIAPNEELAAREKAELEAKQQVVELAPLRTEFFQVNYAKAADIAQLLKGENNKLLSERGNVTVDERTNTLMVLDTSEKLEEIGRLIETLDVPIRQVLIESRIVIANDDYSRELGARFGVNSWQFDEDPNVFTSGTVEGTQEPWDSFARNADGTFEVAAPVDRLNVDLPVTASGAGNFAVALLSGDYLVDLELSALQTEGRGEVISNPRVITSNQKEATIEQGVEVPYQEASSSGATSVSFKKAVLSLTVTPQITPDDRVIMDLQVNKDSVGEVYAGVPTINTRAINTQVLVENGDTVVLGGIYEQTRLDGVEKVPFLGDLPVLGMLFRRTTKIDDKTELLIFVTPKILKEGIRTAPR